jgi:signal transduction histidine kinase
LATHVQLFSVSGLDALTSFDRINLGSTLLQCAVVLGFAAAQEGVARHFRRSAMRSMAMVWRLFALAAVLNIVSSWSGAVWNDRTMSRVFTTCVVALLAAAIPHARTAFQALAAPDEERASVRRESFQWALTAMTVHAIGVFGAAVALPDLRIVTVTISRSLHLVVLTIPALLAWRIWRGSTRHPRALQLLTIGFAALSLRQAMAVALGFRVGMPDLPFSTVLLFVTLDVLAILTTGVCTLLASTAEEVSLLNAQSRELATARERVLAGERMESLGRMAAGIAHDMNNVLQVLSLSWEVQRQEMPVHAITPADHQLNEEVDSAMMHGRALVSQLMSFARTRPSEISQFDPAERMRALSAMLRRMAGPSIALTVEGTCGQASLRMDPAQFEQIVINLVANARDAVSAGGRITLALDVVSLTLATSPASTLKPGNYVRLRVQDTGTGIPEEIREHIFEPFFTTKETGRGTGLGLATVHGIAQQAAGDVRLESSPDLGTSFEVFLPAA